MDFLLVNSGIYVAMEVSYQASRIATLNNRQGNHTYNRFGGEIPREVSLLRGLPGVPLLLIQFLLTKFFLVNPLFL